MTKNPFISIVIPTYEMQGRGVEFLGVLLSTIFSQKFTDYEIIISDDSSGSDIKNYIQNLGEPFTKKIYYVKHDGPKSISANLNNAIKHATGEVIKVIFQDDAFVRDDALEIIATTYKENPGTTWCLESCVHTHDFTQYHTPLNPYFNDLLLIGVNTIGAPSVLSMRRVVSPHFDTALKMLMDVEFYFRQRAIYGDPTFIKTPLSAMRIWNGQTQNSIDDKDYLLELIHLTKKYPAILSPIYLAKAKQRFKIAGETRKMSAMEALVSRYEYDNRVIDRDLDNDGERVDLNYYWSTYDDLDIYQKSHWKRYEFATSLLSPSDLVADMACGTGYGSVMMSRRCSHVDGYDIDARVVRSIKKRYHEESVLFINKSILELNENSKYDKIISFETVEHLEDKDIPIFFRSVYTALRPGGKFIFSTPYKQPDTPAGRKFHRTFMIDEKTLLDWTSCGYEDVNFYYQNYEDHDIKSVLEKKDFVIAIAAKAK